jgi:MFS family permease
MQTTNTVFEAPRATRREWIGLGVLAIACVLYAMDLTVLHLAVPSLSADLQPSSAQLLWIIDIYGFLVAGSLITMGTLGDRIGRRKLLLIGVVVTNAIVLITFVDQMRQSGMGVYDALIEGGRTRVRPILMTAFTTIIALFPLALSTGDEGGIIGAELARVVIGGMVSSTFLTLIVVPAIYTILHVNLPNMFDNVGAVVSRVLFTRPASAGDHRESND